MSCIKHPASRMIIKHHHRASSHARAFSKVMLCPLSCQVQYRMHPSISAFPNAQFYDSALQDGITAEQRPRPAFNWPSSRHPVVFFDIKGAEQATQGGSKSNRVEAAAVVEALKKLLDGGLSLGQIGIVSPYAAQVQILSELTRSIDGSSDDGRGRYSSSDAGGHQGSGLHASCALGHAG
jgi:hypothetical protein